jgi:hypothetical protein
MLFVDWVSVHRVIWIVSSGLIYMTNSVANVIPIGTFARYCIQTKSSKCNLHSVMAVCKVADRALIKLIDVPGPLATLVCYCY